MTAAPPPPVRPTVSRPRRVGEVALALVALSLAAPVLLAAGALVALTSPGRALYSQVRVGLGGRTFRIYKLRTMTVDSESQGGARWCAGHDDPRVTSVGRYLRRTHLDELPQLWNVLRGEMAFVGPRPERPEILASLAPHVPGLADRLAVRPGVTGLAQIQQPADSAPSTFCAKLEYDRLYIRDSSVGLDLRIILGTVFYLGGLSYNAVRLLAALPRPVTAAEATRAPEVPRYAATVEVS